MNKSQSKRLLQAFVWAATSRSQSSNFWTVVVFSILIIGSWSVLTAWQNLTSLKSQVEVSKKVVDETIKANASLKTNVTSVSQAYIVESTARLNLNKRKVGEQILVVKPGSESVKSNTAIIDPEPVLWWQWIFHQDNQIKNQNSQTATVAQ